MSKRDKSINTVFKADGWKMKTNGMGNDVLSLWGFLALIKMYENLIVVMVV